MNYTEELVKLADHQHQLLTGVNMDEVLAMARQFSMPSAFM